jgi:hypothetical protein
MTTEDPNDRHGYAQPTRADHDRLRAERDAALARLARCRALVDMAYRINRTYPPPVGLASLEAIVGRTR